ncbi:MAG: leucine-rich repeat domain-containing protein [Lachnospiraceae bacterium]|nr:leucine-rich repeat domain-containing protein [Lachnospiraceae bacterium]
MKKKTNVFIRSMLSIGASAAMVFSTPYIGARHVSAEEEICDITDEYTSDGSENDTTGERDIVESQTNEDELVGVSGTVIETIEYNEDITFTVYDTNGDGIGNHLEICGSGSIGFDGEFMNNESITTINVSEGITKLGYAMFYGMTNVTSINLPDSLTFIDWGLFFGTNISSINIPTNVTYINAFAFAGCNSLTSITIPSNVETISARAFESCGNLSNVVIEDGVTNIDLCAFGDCEKLKSIYIPASVTTIGEYAVGFYGRNNGIEYVYDTTPGFVIYGEEGSAAEEYAKENGLAFYTNKNMFTLESYQVSVSDNFNLKYIMKLSDAAMKDANSYMEFSIEGKTQNAKASYTDDGKAAYCCELPAIQMGDKIIAKLYVGGQYYDVSEYSIKEYLDTIIENKYGNSEYNDAKDLAIAILNYGSYCQKYFGYKTDEPVNSNMIDSDAAFDAVSEQTIINSINNTVGVTKKNSSFDYLGASFTCLSDTSLNIFFTNDSEITADDLNSKYTISVNNNDESNVEYSFVNGILKVTVKGISAANLDNTYTFTVNSADDSLTVEYCPLVYIEKALSISNNNDLKNLCKALYIYNQEANKYVSK